MIVVTHADHTFPVVVEYRTGRQPAGPWVAHLAEEASMDGVQGWVLQDESVPPGQAATLDEAVERLAANIAAAFPSTPPSVVRIDHGLTDQQAEQWAEMLAADTTGR